MTWLDSGGQRSKVKVTEGRRDGEGINIDASRSRSSSSVVLCCLQPNNEAFCTNNTRSGHKVNNCDIFVFGISE